MASVQSTVSDQMISTTLGMWGTSNAVRIPKRVCEQAGIGSGSTVTVENGRDARGAFILIRPVEEEPHRSYGDAPYKSIDEIFAGYRGGYKPAEFDWGADVGGEIVR